MIIDFSRAIFQRDTDYSQIYNNRKGPGFWSTSDLSHMTSLVHLQTPLAGFVCRKQAHTQSQPGELCHAFISGVLFLELFTVEWSQLSPDSSSPTGVCWTCNVLLSLTGLQRLRDQRDQRPDRVNQRWSHHDLQVKGKKHWFSCINVNWQMPRVFVVAFIDLTPIKNAKLCYYRAWS